MTRRGFTLTELLIVIAIIMILLGLLFPVIGMIRTQSFRAKALSQLQTIRAACDQYRNLNGAFPDSVVMQGVFLPGGTGTTPVQWAAITPANWGTIATELVSRLQTIDRDNFAPGSPISTMLDPWKNVYRYRPNQYYPYAQPPCVPIDSTNPPNADSVQLWSCAQNTRDDAGQSGSYTNSAGQTVTGDDLYLK